MASLYYCSASATQCPAVAFSGSSELHSDLASLEQHMHHCASAQGILRRLEQALRTAHSLVCPRIVTLAAGTTLMTVAAISVVVGVIELL